MKKLPTKKSAAKNIIFAGEVTPSLWFFLDITSYESYSDSKRFMR
jgi:hypothetical protein